MALSFLRISFYCCCFSWNYWLISASIISFCLFYWISLFLSYCVLQQAFQSSLSCFFIARQCYWYFLLLLSISSLISDYCCFRYIELFSISLCLLQRLSLIWSQSSCLYFSFLAESVHPSSWGNGQGYRSFISSRSFLQFFYLIWFSSSVLKSSFDWFLLACSSSANLRLFAAYCSSFLLAASLAFSSFCFYFSWLSISCLLQSVIFLLSSACFLSLLSASSCSYCLLDFSSSIQLRWSAISF